MAILDFQKPDKVIMIQSDEHKGQFEFRPLEPGYGITVGNALRRILLSSLEGFAIASIRIEGADHEFTTLKGVVEDITEIVYQIIDTYKSRILNNDFLEEATKQKAILKLSKMGVKMGYPDKVEEIYNHLVFDENDSLLNIVRALARTKTLHSS